ncbi:hypothetical protein [Paenibacillus sp. NPDC058177]|uniref:hypothetical protein n=1 Tax=Paenibacillus sp. NPDC058177 TaxID=3346369 RepID=UPI0036DB5B5C
MIKHPDGRLEGTPEEITGNMKLKGADKFPDILVNPASVQITCVDSDLPTPRHNNFKQYNNRL